VIDKLLIKRELTVLNILALLIGKLFIGISLGMIISNYYLPYTYPLLVIGIMLVLPGIYYLFKEENSLEKFLLKKLRKRK